MKVKVNVVKHYEFDDEAELKRLKSCFKGNTLKRQLKIFNHFKNEEWELMKAAYHDLPYNKQSECSEKEFVGMWLDMISGGFFENEGLVESYRTVEFIKE